tara:strand:- start:363 stop:740 length:378 start_codon:yes stop_codon:yes gene_type:complete
MLPAVKKNQPLTDMQQAFIDEYVTNGGEREAAAIHAGYSPSTARVQAYDLMRKPHVLHAILERCAEGFISDAPKATQRLRELMNARSEYVSLQATQDVLDRAGLKPTERVDHRIAGDVSVSIDLS